LEKEFVMDAYQSEAEIAEIVRGFESCETGADDFKHGDHLVVAIWYLQTMDKQAALDRMRDGLLRFLDHHVGETSKYSEEITSFWIERVAEQLDKFGSDSTVLEKCNRVVESAQFGPQIYADKSAD
jgi:hypothetical protein